MVPHRRPRQGQALTDLRQRRQLTVAENATLPARLRGRPDDPELWERLGLDAIRDRPAGATSLGEQQRTALARALILKPRVAVLDEPTAHQDDDHVDLILTALTAASRGSLVLVATHDQRVIDVADQTVHLTPRDLGLPYTP